MAESRKARGDRPARLTRASLENAALAYLGRFASSSGNLRRVLLRKVARAARRARDGNADGNIEAGTEAEAVRIIDEIVARYLETGLLNDRAYAGQAAASLARRGTSRFGIAGKLRQKGVEAELLAETMASLDESEEVSERAAACALVRRRRLGPYRAAGQRPAWRERDLASLARAGFSLDLARRVLAAPDPETLERLARGEDPDS